MSRGGSIDKGLVEERLQRRETAQGSAQCPPKMHLGLVNGRLGGVSPDSKPSPVRAKGAAAADDVFLPSSPPGSLMDAIPLGGDDELSFDGLFDVDPCEPEPEPVLPAVHKAMTFAQCKAAFAEISTFMQRRAGGPQPPKKLRLELPKRPSKAMLDKNKYLETCDREKAPVSIEYVLHGDTANAQYPFSRADKHLLLAAGLRTKTAEQSIKGPPRSSVSGEDEIAPVELCVFLGAFGAPSVADVVLNPGVPLSAGAVFGIPVGSGGQHYAVVAQIVPGPDERMALNVIGTSDGQPIELRKASFAANMVGCLHKATTGPGEKKPRFRKRNVGQRSPGYMAHACPGVFVNPGYDDMLVCALRALVTHPFPAIQERVQNWLRAWAEAYMLQPPHTQADMVEVAVCMTMVELFTNPLYARGRSGQAAERAAALCTVARYEMLKTALTSECAVVEHMAALWAAEDPDRSPEAALATAVRCTSYEGAKVALGAV